MPRSTDPRKLALWRERFAKFSRGELAVGAFCSREHVSVASFYYWREKLGEFKEAGDDRPSTFQPVTVIPAVPAIRIELPCGTRIEVGTADLEVVRAVVGVVARSDHGRDGKEDLC
jgi:hypothetical protein